MKPWRYSYSNILEQLTEMNKIGFFCFFTVALVASCSRNNPSKDGIPVIDATKNYPEKEILLTDIADVTYVHLDTKSDDFLYKGGISYLTENTIVVQDVSSGSVLFFSKDGTPISHFNRHGLGPQEYRGRRSSIAYDEVTDEVFIYNGTTIQIYSSQGEYKRSIPLPYNVIINQMDCFDDQSLILFDINRRWYKAQPKTPEDNIDYLTHTIDSSFMLISRVDGQVLDYIEMFTEHKELSVKPTSGGAMMLVFTDLVKHAEGYLLGNPATDTIFLYNKNRELTPIICKIPLLSHNEPKIILNNCIDVDNYQFIVVQTMSYGQLGNQDSYKYLMRDKQTGEIFRQKIVMPDYQEKKITISPNLTNYFHENGTHIELDLIELKQAYNDNKLSGKLKELVASLNEFDDNNVFMFIKFKKESMPKSP